MALGNGQTREATQSSGEDLGRANRACREPLFTRSSCGDHLHGGKKPGFGAKGAEGDPKPQMFNLAFDSLKDLGS
jgi:hypothetical protein